MTAKKPARVYLQELKQPKILSSLSYFPQDPLENKRVKALREYTKVDAVIKNKKSDFKQAMEIARFTSRSWGHNGFNSKRTKNDALTILKLAKKGASFSCVQFGSVFVQLCQSVGIPARVLQVTAKNPQLGSSGMAHITGEYFDNQLNKWVWVDPQIHAYATYRDKPLSFTELSELMVAGKKPKIVFTSRTLEYIKGNGSNLKALESFVEHYIFRSMVAGMKAFYTSQKEVIPMACQRQGLLPSITFQGFADVSPQLVDAEVFDAPMNSCQVRIQTFAPKKTVAFTDVHDYKKNAQKNFVRSEVKLLLTHSMPWFSHFEVVLNGRVSKATGSADILEKPIKLKPGKNRIKIQAVNQRRRKGPATEVIIHWDDKYQDVKSYW